MIGLKNFESITFMIQTSSIFRLNIAFQRSEVLPLSIAYRNNHEMTNTDTPIKQDLVIQFKP